VLGALARACHYRHNDLHRLQSARRRHDGIAGGGAALAIRWQTIREYLFAHAEGRGLIRVSRHLALAGGWTRKRMVDHLASTGIHGRRVLSNRPKGTNEPE